MATNSRYPKRIHWNAATRSRAVLLAVLAITAFSGMYFLMQSNAATGDVVSMEAEDGMVSGPAAPSTDVAASGGQFVRFGAATPPPAVVPPAPQSTPTPPPAATNPYVCPAPYPTIRVGATGVCVQRAQWYLNQLNNAGLNIDGNFGPLTETAVRNFQSARGLTVDGVVGPGTWLAMEPGAPVTPPPAPTPTPSPTPTPPPTGTVGGVPGYAFPVAPQRKSQNSKITALSPLPCYVFANCHRGTAAFDMGRQPGGDSSAGAPLYAITDGVVQTPSLYKGISGCYAFQFKSSKDGFYYWYGHLGAVTVAANQTVRVGQQITTIGRRACTGNGSLPHLHIDRGCIIDGVKQPGGRTTCRDADFIPLMNNIFNGLPN